MSLQIDSVMCGYLKLDGGAMFGIVPKRMWEKIYPCDDQNLCTWAIRSILIQTDDRKILIDCGVGDKQDDKFRSHFYPHGKQVIESLSDKQIQAEEITDVFITHLHFDHVGGAFKRDGDKIVPTFPEAKYWTSEEHFQWAEHSNLREKASFLPENILPLKEKGRATFVETETDDFKIFDFLSIRFLYGHTHAMMMPIIHREGESDLIFCTDLLPSSAHLGLPYIMAYDINPLQSVDEKSRLLSEAVEAGSHLFLEHDARHEAISIVGGERGKYGFEVLNTSKE